MRRYYLLGTSLLLTLLCTALAPGAARGREADAARDPEQARAVADLRNVGTAMMSWLTDQVSGDMAPVDLAEGEGAPLEVAGKEGEEPASYTPITYARLQALLQPHYIQVIPERDPWGYPYEFFLNRNLLGANVLAIRSAGGDGEFATGPYAVGGFDADDLDQDIVWVDGYFVRWPEAR